MFINTSPCGELYGYRRLRPHPLHLLYILLFLQYLMVFVVIFQYIVCLLYQCFNSVIYYHMLEIK